MKLRYLLICLLLLSTMSFAQKEYPLVTIKDIQYRPDDSLKAGRQSSPLLNDTVRIRAIVMNSTLRNPNDPTSQPLIFPSVTARYSVYVQDSSAKEWGGLLVMQSPQDAPTMLNIADTAQYVEFVGYPSEYNQTTQFNLISSVQINPLGVLPRRPVPVEAKISDFITNEEMNPLAEKYEGMYLIFRNVTVTDKNTSDGSFAITDDKGNKIYMYAQSGYNAIGRYQFTGYTGYKVPENGTKLEYIRGMIQDWWSATVKGYRVAPIYPDDIKIASMPPSISTLKRNSDLVAPNQNIDVTAKIIAQPGGNVSEAKIYYRVNGSAYKNVAMAKTADTTIFKGTIPAVTDSALIDYFVWSQDNIGQTSYFPTDTAKGNYLIQVLNRPLTIKDVQYSPLGGGYGAYTGYKVTLTGIVTADTSGLPGNGGASGEIPRVYMQDGTGPWSGLWVYGVKAYTLKQGDKITVNGTITESNNNTRIDSISTLTVVSSNNTVPAPVELSTADIATKGNGTLDAEKWEGMLVKYTNVKVLNSNADNTSNYGELLIGDQSGTGTRVELQDGAGTYHNSWDANIEKAPGWTKIQTGDQFSSLTGVLIYSYSNYKIFPRKNDDFAGFKTGVEAVNNKVPSSYNLLQNYPNPFNPSTTIEYSVPEGGRVTLKVYNMLGQEVCTLVNQFQNSGNYKATFNANNLPSGIYLYQLDSGSFKSVKKMLLLK